MIILRKILHFNSFNLVEKDRLRSLGTIVESFTHLGLEIAKDVEMKEEGEFDTRTVDGSVGDETGQGGLRENISTDTRRKNVYVEGVLEGGITSREPGDRIELDVSTVT